MEEPSFPRGGKEKFVTAVEDKNLKRKQNDDLFGKANTQKTSKKGKRREKAPDIDIDFSAKLKVVEPLTYKTLSEGMLVLGCIREIQSYHMNVSLPGRLTGRVAISAVSKQYSEALSSSNNVPPLEEIFFVGQHVVTKVTSIAMEKSYYQVTLSLAPDEIHSELTHSSVKEGMVLTGAVTSIEDHGYLIDFGIDSLRAFLKKTEVKAFRKAYNINELAVGQLIRCLVTKSKSSSTSTTLELSADPSAVNEALVPRDSGINPHLVIPGMRFEVDSLMPVGHGVAVKWLNFDGYVHVDHYPHQRKPLESQFSEDETLSATVLYSLPLVRTVFLTMQKPHPFSLECKDPNLATNGVPSNCDVSIGEVVDNAEVVSTSFRGLTLKLKKSDEVFGFVGLTQIPKMTEEEKLKLLYPPQTKVQCRVLKYDVMDRLLMCTMLKDKIKDKMLMLSDLKPGSTIHCQITEVRKKDLYLEVNKHPNLKARVPSIHLSDTHVSDIGKRFSVGQRVKGRIISVDTEKNIIFVTLKPSLVLSRKPILSYYSDIPQDKFFEGVVYLVDPKFYLVSFFNGVSGKLSLSNIPVELNSKFSLGQTINVRVAKVIGPSKLKLSMENPEEEKEGAQLNFEVGREYSAVVDSIYGKEIKLTISSKDLEGVGFVPKPLVTAHLSLADSLMKSLSAGDKVKATCLATNLKGKGVFTIDQELAHTLKGGMDEELKVYALLPGFVKTIAKTGVIIRTISKNSENSKTVIAFHRSLADDPVEEIRDIFSENQPIMFRVESVVEETEEHKEPISATGSTKLMDVCPYGVEQGGATFMQNYMNTYVKIHSKLKKAKNAIVTYEPGQMVSAKIASVHVGLAEVKLDGSVKGFINSYHSQGAALAEGQEVQAVVIWVDMGTQCVQLSTRPDILKQIHRDQVSCPKPKIDSTHRGEVILTNDDVAVVILKGQCRGLIAVAPVKRHINDSTPIEYQLGKTCKFVFKSLDTVLPTCVNKRDLPNKGKKPKVHPGSLEKKIQKMDSKESKKRQVEIKEEVASDDEVGEVEVKRLKVDDEATKEEDREILDAPDEDEMSQLRKEEIQIVKKIGKKKSDPQTLKVDNFVWDPNHVKEEDEESSSDESDGEEAPKKKMTLAERRALARKEEEKLVKAEQKLLNEEQTPQSIDEFDRLIMASPDSSIIWVQYMAFHLQATEIEKARAVARKAIKTISFREEQEKLNVWVALLNLENLYGTPESLEKTLQEAVQLNDAKKVYVQMLKIFGDTNKIEEGNSLFDTMLRKFRSDKEMWVYGGTFYFQTNQLEKGRHLLQRGLRSLENRDHVDVICRFAHLENKYGSAERCHTLFEHILSSYPKRTDIWNSYVDLLIKAGNVDAARSLLDRAIAQKLPVRKMKVIFKKYLEFAQQHGNEDEVEAIKTKAQEFVQSVASNLPINDDSDVE
ncbi:protein RRP5 homolog [Neocloeon triangulifer]|uniref:protein RRP5 homolog n=1 Tax=Neocloeon triangulifer TaxID=2078957 RepID=UPI00286EE030|nr:protein RRP5 homolog [Neocloeon triangulifer]